MTPPVWEYLNAHFSLFLPSDGHTVEGQVSCRWYINQLPQEHFDWKAPNEVLDRLGRDGWELVYGNRWTSGDYVYETFYLKRVKSSN